MRWFKTESTIFDNADIQKLIDKYGYAGVGRYLHILAEIAKRIDKDNLHYSLRNNNQAPMKVGELSRLLRTMSEPLANFIGYLVSIGLLDKKPWKDENIISCVKMAKWAKEYVRKLRTCDGHAAEERTKASTIEIEEEVRSKKEQKSSGAKTSAPSTLFLKWYGEEFKSRSGGKTYMATFDVDHVLVKQMLADLGEDELKRRTILFLDDTDPWLDKAGRTIKILRSRINSYVPTQPPQFGGMPPPPKDPSCGPAKKFEPVDKNSEAYRRYRRLYHGEK